MKASRGTVVGLIVAATALFVVGILLEKGSEGDHHDEGVAEAAETPAEQAAETPAEHAAEGGEAASTKPEQPKGSAGSAVAGESPAEHAAESGEVAHSESSEESDNEADEKVLGIKYESTPLVILAVLASLAMAALVWFARVSWIFLLVAAAMLAFAVFDIAEVFHQVDLDEGGIAALAGLVAVLHLAAAIGSAQLRREPAAS